MPAQPYAFFLSEISKHLLRKARQSNAAMGITGMLVYCEGNFFQVLEGDTEAVAAVFSRISADTSHAKVTEIIREPIARRTFGEWSMGFAALNRQEIDDAIGANDFFTEGLCIQRLDGGRAKKLLAAFRAGRWRQRIGEIDLKLLATG